jgi:hypothetical protein
VSFVVECCGGLVFNFGNPLSCRLPSIRSFFSLGCAAQSLVLPQGRRTKPMTIHRRIALLALIVSATAAFAQKRQPQPAANTAPAQPIKLMVDATHAPEKILHAQLQIPVASGEVKLDRGSLTRALISGSTSVS